MNCKDEYPQMTAWLEHHEKVQQHAALINRKQDPQVHQHTETWKMVGPPFTHAQCAKMAHHPSAKNVSFDVLKVRYGALDFQDELADFVAQVNNPGASRSILSLCAEDTLIPFRGVPVFHVIKFTGTDGSQTTDSVHAQLEQRDKRRRIIPSRFDTVLVQSPSPDTRQGWIKGNSYS